MVAVRTEIWCTGGPPPSSAVPTAYILGEHEESTHTTSTLRDAQAARMPSVIVEKRIIIPLEAFPFCRLRDAARTGPRLSTWRYLNMCVLFAPRECFCLFHLVSVMADLPRKSLGGLRHGRKGEECVPISAQGRIGNRRCSMRVTKKSSL